MELRQPNKPYHTDHNIVFSCQYHVIFCPRSNRKVLNRAVTDRLRNLVFDRQVAHGSTLMELAVQLDQVHFLLGIDSIDYQKGV